LTAKEPSLGNLQKTMSDPMGGAVAESGLGEKQFKQLRALLVAVKMSGRTFLKMANGEP